MNGSENFDAILKLLNEKHQQEIKWLENDFNKQVEELRKENEELRSDMNNHVKTIEQKLNNKLEAVDTALRGNGRIGIFEELRNITVKFRVVYTCIFILFGLKFMGYGLDDWIKHVYENYLGKENIEQVEVLNPTDMLKSNLINIGKSNNFLEVIIDTDPRQNIDQEWWEEFYNQP